MHTCDNPPCCNPKHLVLGDAILNAQDMFRKGRNTSVRCKGADHPQAKLTEKDVVEMRSLRASGWLLSALSRRFLVTETLVSLVCRKRIWKHVA